MDVAGAVYFPKDCHLSPEKYLAALQRHCEQAGVKFVWNAEVKKIEFGKTSFHVTITLYGNSGKGVTTERQSTIRNPSRIEVVETTNGEFSAGEIILCGGSWSLVIVRELRLKIPIQAGKGYSLTLTQPRELPQLCSIFTEARMAITPMGTSLR